ncbi:O-antigen ligase family protein [Salinibacter ruber]|uniref:Uncharacterized protein n=1 Tax=Salinibacter ruber TaxID=146919 RepID=A0A9X2QAU8_9BACT|nr:hypothetical protein [Salinibacter ruber]MCS3662052.1 hypothetical protein [Salinibacter ruber]MCS3711893.1 hypothetical protein [Salinibacter ruber]
MPMQHRSSSLWMWGVAAFLLLAVFDGALRKWVMPSQSLALYVLKDVLLVGGYALYALEKPPFQLPRPLKKTWFPVLLGVYIYVVCLQAFNFTQPNFAVRILGLKAHLASLPLLVLLPALLARLRQKRIEQLLFGFMAFVALPVMLLGIYQFFQPPTAWINRYVAEGVNVATVSGNPRVTGTFSYIAGMTAFMLFNTLLGFGVLIGGMMTGRRWVMWGGGIFLGLCIVVLPLSGSRAPLYFSTILIAGVSLLVSQRRGGGTSVLLGLALASGVVVLVFTQTNLDEGWAALEERIETTDDEEGRIKGIISGPITGIEKAGLFGYGVGTLHQAAPRLASGSPSAWGVTYVENTVERIILELGALGWFVLVVLKCVIAWMAYQALRRARSVFEFAVSTVALGKGIMHILFPVVFFVTTNITYWVAVGLLLYVWSSQQLREAPRGNPEQRARAAA